MINFTKFAIQQEIGIQVMLHRGQVVLVSVSVPLFPDIIFSAWLATTW